MDDFNSEFLDSPTLGSNSFVDTTKEDSLTNASQANFQHKIHVHTLETSFLNKETAYKKDLVTIRSKNECLVDENARLKDKCAQLEMKNKQLNRKSIYEGFEKESSFIDQTKRLKDLEQELLKVSEAKDSIIADLQDQMGMYEDKNCQLINANNTLQSQVNLSKMGLLQSNDLLNTYKERANNNSTLIQENDILRQKLMEAEKVVEDMSKNVEEVGLLKKVNEIYKGDLKRLQELEAATQKFEETKLLIRKKDENVALLNEKLQSQQAELSRARDRLGDYDILKSKYEILQEDYEAAKSKATNHVNVDLLNNKIMVLDRCNCELSRKNVELEEELADTRQNRLNDRKENSHFKTQLSAKKDKTSSLEVQLNRYRKKMQLVTNERNSLRLILQSYDADLTSTTENVQLQKRIKVLSEADQKKSLYVNELEDHIKKSETSFSSMDTSEGMINTSGPCQNCEKLTEENKNLRSDIEIKQDKILEFERKVEYGRMKGDYNPDSTRVMHFKMNPNEIARNEDKEMIEDLKKENTKLKCKVKEMQQGHEVSMCEIETSRGSKEQLRLAELRNERLKEGFLTKIREYQQAVYCLFGYRMDRGDVHGQFRLLSMYAASKDDYLLFHFSDADSGMELIETPFSQRIGSLIDLHLHKQDSIPMFCCAISIQLFEDQTQFD